MKLSGYLIEKYNNMGAAYTCRRILEEAAKQSVDLQILGAADSYFTKTGCYNRNSLLEKRDLIINRYKYGKVKDALNDLGQKSYNDVRALNIYLNKSEQLKNIGSEYFQKPRYITGTYEIPLPFLADTLNLPFVAKGLESSMGKEIFLIKNEEDFAALKKSFPPAKEWIFQEFIKESYGRDMRVFCARGEVLGAMERSSVADFRANVALGAKVKNMPITPELKHIAHDIYAQTGLDIIGLDLLFGKDGFYFCEINVTPGLEGIERATASNIAGQIMAIIKGDFYAD